MNGGAPALLRLIFHKSSYAAKIEIAVAPKTTRCRNPVAGAPSMGFRPQFPQARHTDMTRAEKKSTTPRLNIILLITNLSARETIIHDHNIIKINPKIIPAIVNIVKLPNVPLRLFSD